MQRFIQKHLYKRSVLSYLLFPFSLVYMFVGYLKRRLFVGNKVGSIPIIGVGSIVSGGTGKTPLTLFLAKYLSKKGKKTAIITRGYKGSLGSKSVVVDKNSPLQLVGDEAKMLFVKLPEVPIVVGRNRAKSIQIINSKFPKTDFIIADDVFQNGKIKRAFDIVVFSSNGGVGNGFVLPAGILRESLTACKYADLIVIVGKDKKLQKRLCRFNKNIVYGDIRVVGFFDLAGKRVEVQALKSKQIALVSAIGNPKSFEQTITSLGLKFEEHFALDDHSTSYKRALQRIKKMKADFIITTEKDFVKMDKPPRNLLVCRVKLQMDEDILNEFRI